MPHIQVGLKSEFWHSHHYLIRVDYHLLPGPKQPYGLFLKQTDDKIFSDKFPNIITICPLGHAVFGDVFPAYHWTVPSLKISTIAAVHINMMLIGINNKFE